jgi:predicted cobalt transporter CbtA
MTAAAAFSNRPWQPADTFDRTEDFLHSLSATAMGFAFAAGVVTAGLLRGDRDLRLRILDLLAVVASVGLPLGMSAAPATDGLLQRAMFAIAYVWYGVEAVRAIQDRRAQMKGPGSRSAPDSGPEPARSGHP